MRNLVRPVRRVLVRLFEALLSLTAALVPSLASRRRDLTGKPLLWPSGRKAYGVFRDVVSGSTGSFYTRGLPRHGAGDYSSAAFLILLLIVGGVIVLIQLVLFQLIDSHICDAVTLRKAPDLSSLALGAAKVEFLPSSNAIVRAVYLDPRPRNGFINTSVFLVELRKGVLTSEAIVACGVGSRVSSQLTVRSVLNSEWVHVFYPQLTHDVAILDCFGLPDTPSGARAFLWYTQPNGDGQPQLYRVESEQRYFVPLPKKTLNEDDVKIVVCMGVVRDFPPYMNEFLRYYKHLGVDHVYMTGEDSFFHNGGLQRDNFVQNAVREGFISFTFWHQWLSPDEVFYHSQMLAHQDCIYRFQGTYDYAFIVDSDDYFVPLVPHRNTLDFYVEQYCRFGSCVFPWIEYYPDCGQHWERLGDNGNVTNTLVSLTHQRRFRTGKSIHRLTAILDAGTHKPQILLSGYHYVFVPPDAAYVAHIRKNKHPPDGLQSC